METYGGHFAADGKVRRASREGSWRIRIEASQRVSVFSHLSSCFRSGWSLGSWR